MVTARPIHIVPPAHLPRPRKFPMPATPGLWLPAATIQTSLRWQRLLASQAQAEEARPRLYLQAPPQT
jgi:hypothetical protein